MDTRETGMKQEDYSIWLEDDCYQYINKDHPPVKRKIVAAANKHKDSDLLVVGARHFSKAMVAQIKAMGLNGRDFQEQGFIDQYDQFVTREDARRIAISNGQPLIRDDWGKLYSENLY